VSSLYRILDDFSIEDRWHLRAPETEDGRELDARDFLSCKRYDGPIPLRVQLRRSGQPLQFTFADFDMPIVSQEVHHCLAKFDGDWIQLIPVIIEDVSDSYWILNVLQRRECVDEERSEFMKWKADDARPDKTGQYRMFAKLVLNKEQTSDAPIFRIDGWKTALIVSKDIKHAVEEGGSRGVRFEPVG
jgi:hypothetical protein